MRCGTGSARRGWEGRAECSAAHLDHSSFYQLWCSSPLGRVAGWGSPLDSSFFPGRRRGGIWRQVCGAAQGRLRADQRGPHRGGSEVRLGEHRRRCTGGWLDDVWVAGSRRTLATCTCSSLGERAVARQDRMQTTLNSSSTCSTPHNSFDLHDHSAPPEATGVVPGPPLPHAVSNVS